MTLPTHIGDLRFLSKNPRRHNPTNIGMIADALQEVGAARSIVIDENDQILAGNGTIEAAAQTGITKVQVVEADGETIIAVRRRGLTDIQKARLAILDNRANETSDWDAVVLAEMLGNGVVLNDLWGDDELRALLGEASAEAAADTSVTTEAARQTLAQRFGVPPFSVLDARQGYWQERKKAWLALGIHSEVGREEQLTFAESAQSPSVYALRNEMRAARGSDPTWPEVIEEAKQRGLYVSTGTSIFDPVLCELAYRWFCPESGVILDPFAGGSVRGLVASRLGRRYTGVDLRQEQVEANRTNWNEFAARFDEEMPLPLWVCGDSQNLADLPGVPNAADFVFSCPPYADLEVYSDNPRDLSRMDYEEFLAAYRVIIGAAVAKLKNNRFACFVVGDVRDKKGFYRNFVSDTIAAFQDAGAMLYNEAVLVTTAGSLPMRVNAQFGKYRKLGKTHQNCLVFYKGDPKKIPEILGETEWGELAATGEEAIEEAINE